MGGLFWSEALDIVAGLSEVDAERLVVVIEEHAE